MRECSKSVNRRMNDPNFMRHYFVGNGIDIGGKPDPLSLYAELFPLMKDIKIWDIEDGDAQFLTTVSDNSFDFVHSSHCLEHLVDPTLGLKNWLRILKPNGYMIVTVPEEDLYEQGVFPSTFNKDHKWTFTIHKQNSWSTKSINITNLLIDLGDCADIIKIEKNISSYRFELPRYDQTLTPIAECSIEFIIRKRPNAEIIQKGLVRDNATTVSDQVKVHLNQYKDDYESMKKSNADNPPFKNLSDIPKH